MAITKIIGAVHPPKSGSRYKVLKNTIDYVLNTEKTEGGRYTGSLNCIQNRALQSMVKTKEFYGKTSSAPSERLGYHFVISWSPDEKVSEDTAFQVVKEFCEKYLGDQYEAVYSLHTDQEHPHGHIVFNSVNLKTGRKYRYEDGDWAAKIQPPVDELCKKYHLHTLEMDTGMDLGEYEKERTSGKRKQPDHQQTYSEKRSETQKKHSNTKYYNEKMEDYTKMDFIRHDIDEIILDSNTYEEFLQGLRRYGYDVRVGTSKKHGEYFALRGRGMERARRSYLLGADYRVEMIKKRIEIKNKPLPILPLWKIWYMPFR